MSQPGAAHDDHHEAFDPEPTNELGADETPSPGWLPLAGGSLLLLAVGYVFYPSDGVAAKAPDAAPAAAAAPSVAPKPAAPPPRGSAATPPKRTEMKGNKPVLRKMPGK